MATETRVGKYKKTAAKRPTGPSGSDANRAAESSRDRNPEIPCGRFAADPIGPQTRRRPNGNGLNGQPRPGEHGERVAWHQERTSGFAWFVEGWRQRATEWDDRQRQKRAEPPFPRESPTTDLAGPEVTRRIGRPNRSSPNTSDDQTFMPEMTVLKTI